MAKSIAKKQATPAPSIEMVPTAKIIFDGQNPRKEFNSDAMAELVESVKQNGILSPIMIRPGKGMTIKTKGYEGEPYLVVYGARRFSAACELDMKEVPCIIRDMTDDEAFEIQITENLQRKNINVMEESDAFHQLRRRGISTPEMIADKLGVSVRYVYDRLVLQNVIKEVQDQIRAGKLSISHGKQLARLPKEDQEKVWESLRDEHDIHVDDIREQINRKFTLKLASAPFDIKSGTLVRKAGSCMKCEKRTGCRLVLFEEAEQDDICLDNECYNNKVQAHIDSTIKKLKDEGKVVKLLAAAWSTKGDLHIGKITWDDWQIDEDDEDKPEPNAYGIMVEAPTWSDYKIGQVVPLHIPEEKEEVNGHSNASSVSSLSSKSHKGWVDHDEKFAEFLATKVCNFYELQNNMFSSFDINELLIGRIAQTFWRLQDEIQEVIVRLLEIPKIKDQGDDESVEWCPRTSMAEYCKLYPKDTLPKMYLLMEVMKKVDEGACHLDIDEAKEINDLLASTGLDVFKIADEYRNDHPGALEHLVITETAEA